jgi:hypothetical protein
VSEAHRFAFLVFIGTALMQAAWILAVPPYRAIDEFDHAYRAAGVARGQWVLEDAVSNGRGLAVAVPPGMVEAAEEQCESLGYTLYGNCHPIEFRDDRTVVVATSAGTYNPLYYAFIGYVAKPFDGATADYVMRSASALVCALGIALAALCLGLMRAGPWARLGLAVAMTPTLLFTSVLPAPNSVEIVAALVTWCSLLAVFSARLSAQTERRLVWVAGIAAVVTVVPRQLGPLWLVLIAVLLVAFVGLRRVQAVCLEHRMPVVLGTLFVLAATAGTVAWSTFSGFYGESGDVTPSAKEPELKPVWLLVWTLQIVGAFPFRDTPAPPAVYAMYLVILLPFLCVAILRGRGWPRLALLVGILSVFVIPLALTMATIGTYGLIWQGRYQLPVVVGLGLMAGSLIDRRTSRRRSFDAGVTLAALYGASHAWSVLSVQRMESNRTDIGLDPAWVTAPGPALVVMTLLGAVVLVSGPLRQLRCSRHGIVPNYGVDRVGAERRG